MANEKNLKPIRTKSEAREKGKNGGIASGIARREKKTVQKILSDYLDQSVQSQKSLKEIAKEFGIKGEQSIKELVTVACILNTLKRGGDVDKLQKICELLGEENNIQELEDISEAEADIFGNN